jgi:hypothetical protein
MITSNSFTLSETVRTKVVTASTLPQEVHLHNATKSSNEYIHIGGPEMTIANSLHLDPGESKVLQLMPGDDMYAMSDPDGLILHVFTIRQVAF